MPERILAIPLNNNPSERNIIIITRAKPGEANRMDANPTAIAPRIIVPMREPLDESRVEIPEAIKPIPWIKMNIEIIQINVAIAVTGFARAKIPPIIEIIPIPMLIPLEPFVLCAKPPSIILEIPIMINAMPRNVTKSNVVVSGFAKTAPDKAIAIAPSIIWAIRNPLGDFSNMLNIEHDFLGLFNL